MGEKSRQNTSHVQIHKKFLNVLKMNNFDINVGFLF